MHVLESLAKNRDDVTLPFLPSPDSSPPPSDEDGDDDDDDDDDRRRGLRRRLDLLNEDAQQRARGRRIRNITHTNTVTTVYEEGGGRPSGCRTSNRTSSPSPPPPREDVAAAERVDVVDDREKRDIKTASPKRVVGQMIEHGTQTQTIGC